MIRLCLTHSHRTWYLISMCQVLCIGHHSTCIFAFVESVGSFLRDIEVPHDTVYVKEHVLRYYAATYSSSVDKVTIVSCSLLLLANTAVPASLTA